MLLPAEYQHIKQTILQCTQIAQNQISISEMTSHLKTYEKLYEDVHFNPSENYNILESEIAKSMEWDKETVKFNRRKHKRDLWITFGILRSANIKNYINVGNKQKMI